MTIALHPTPSLFAPPISGDAARELAFTALVEAAAARLRAETRTWAEGLRQDAVESAPRIAWWRLVWTGLRVPVHAMFYQHARRRLDLCVAGLARDTLDQICSLGPPALPLSPTLHPVAAQRLIRPFLHQHHHCRYHHPGFSGGRFRCGEFSQVTAASG